MGRRRAAIQFVDRYDLLGIPRPDPETVCLGPCEGTGIIPLMRESLPKYRAEWDMAEAKEPTDDGYHFLKCHDCGGTGRRDGTDVRGPRA